MPKRRFELDTRILAIFLLVAMPFVAVGAYVVVSMGRSAVRDSVAQSLEQRASEASFQVARYLSTHAVVLRLVAGFPEVSDALAAAPAPLGEDAQSRLDEAWGSAQPQLMEKLIGSSLAQRLRGMIEVRPGVKLLQVVDAEGVLLASSSRAGRVLAGKAEWFAHVSQQGLEPQVFVGDVERRSDEDLALYDVAWPVRDREGFFIGAVRAVCDAADLYSVLSPVRIGLTGHAVLVHAETGQILTSDDDQMILRQEYPGFAQLQAAMVESRGSWQVPEITRRAPDGESVTIAPPRLIGYAPITQIPGVEWLVAVEQERAEAVAPIGEIEFWLWLHFVGAFGTAILLGLFFTFRLEAPVIEEELHLHEEHVPPSSRPRATEEAGTS